jgi:hypothetical protein
MLPKIRNHHIAVTSRCVVHLGVTAPATIPVKLSRLAPSAFHGRVIELR